MILSHRILSLRGIWATVEYLCVQAVMVEIT